MSNKKSNYNSLESMLQETDVTTSINIPDKLTIINVNSRAQSGGSKSNSRQLSNNNYVNKLLSMLAEEETNTSHDVTTPQIEGKMKNMLKMKGGKHSPKSSKEELKSFFKKYGIMEVNGINTKSFIKHHSSATNDTTPDTVSSNTPEDSSQNSPIGQITTTAEGTEGTTVEGTSVEGTTVDVNNSSTSTSNTDINNSFHGGAGMNPGFQAFLNLKKKIAEELKISNGPKAAKIAGAVQKEMKAKYTNLNAVEIAAKGLEHFKKNHDKYKKMV
jgi:hypothetical protein